MIYVTGDIHGRSSLGRIYNLSYRLEGGKAEDNYLVVLGDFGLIWSDRKRNPQGYTADERMLDDMESLPFTVLFIDGNHENFHRLAEYPVESWHGGKVARIRKNILHLKRGQVFELEGVTFLALGGAESLDKLLRTAGISWWEEESITDDDMSEARKNLASHGGKVDYVLTHTAPARISRRIVGREYEEKPSDSLLSELAGEIRFKRWYFGHHHTDCKLGRYSALYSDIKELGGS